MEYQWYMYTNYIMNIEFEVDYEPILLFCKKNGLNMHELIMKVACRLSDRHLDQYVVSKNRKMYPARYPAGYVRKIVPDRDMVEWVAVREKEGKFAERLPRDTVMEFGYYLVCRFPRLAFFLARTIFSYHETKDRFTLLVTRNPMRNLGRPIVFHGTGYPGHFLIIPFGKKVRTIFGVPHAFGNIDRFEGFVRDWIEAMEKPETIPAELVEKPYRRLPPKTPEEARQIREMAPKRPPRKREEP
jgi:hypothetical protein